MDSILPVRVFSLLLLLMIPEHAMSEGPCSSTATEISCLNWIRQRSEDRSQFWFGSDAVNKCKEPQLASTLKCSNQHPAPITLSELLFNVNGTDLSSIDRRLDVEFTSEPGTYRGCNTVYTSTETREVEVDPASTTGVKPWDVRNRPSITWKSSNSSSTDLYTVVVRDVGNGFLHGVFVNIPGNNFSNAEIKKDYHGPRNSRSILNPYAFVLYKQTSRVDLASIVLPLWGFNLTSFAETHSLQGPVGLTWMMSSYDAYSAQLHAQTGILNNCALLVANAYKTHKSRPFLPATLDSVSVYMSLQVNASSITYPCGTVNKTEGASSYYVDPIGGPIVSTASARSDSTLTYSLTMRKIFPNNTADFHGKIYTLVTVDPDIPAGRSAGNNSHPLLHGLTTNIQGDNVASGVENYPYFGPMPPDFKTHVYYFLLYEQQMNLNVSTLPFAGSCPARLAGRCMFDVAGFTSNYNMTLVGATWLSAKTDDYVTCPNLPTSGTDILKSSPVFLLVLLFIAASIK